MNEDAERWISNNADVHNYGIPLDVLREAMRWAYADAQRIAEIILIHPLTGETEHQPSDVFMRMLKERAK